MDTGGYIQGPLNLLWEAGARSVSVVGLEFNWWSLQGMFLTVSHACHIYAVLTALCGVAYIPFTYQEMLNAIISVFYAFCSVCLNRTHFDVTVSRFFFPGKIRLFIHILV